MWCLMIWSSCKIRLRRWCQNLILAFSSDFMKMYIVTKHRFINSQSINQFSVWIFENKQLPTKVERPKSIGKKWWLHFFSKSFYIVSIFLYEQHSVIAKYYMKIFLSKLVKMLKENRPNTRTGGILLYSDNASAHCASKTKDF